MKLHRFIGSFDLSQNRIESADPELVHQIADVLRLKAGEMCILGDGALHEALCEVAEISKKRVVFTAQEHRVNENEPKRSVILHCAMLKRENFEWAVQKAVETGVKEIVPIRTMRTVKLETKEDRIKKIIKEAAEQSGRGVVPLLRLPILFKEAISAARSNKLNIVFDRSGSDFHTLSLPGDGLVGVFIGPEGGWHEDEVALAREHKFDVASLGPLTLRAETAAIVASYLATHEIF